MPITYATVGAVYCVFDCSRQQCPVHRRWRLYDARLVLSVFSIHIDQVRCFVGCLICNAVVKEDDIFTGLSVLCWWSADDLGVEVGMGAGCSRK